MVPPHRNLAPAQNMVKPLTTHSTLECSIIAQERLTLLPSSVAATLSVIPASKAVRLQQ